VHPQAPDALRGGKNGYGGGCGIPQPQPQSPGMGLRTMRYRAAMIGATLEIRPGASGGTEVACTLPREL